MQDKVICSGCDANCVGCLHGKPHTTTINCKRGCRDGQYVCIPQQEYRKLKLKKLENNLENQ